MIFEDHILLKLWCGTEELKVVQIKSIGTEPKSFFSLWVFSLFLQGCDVCEYDNVKLFYVLFEDNGLAVPTCVLKINKYYLANHDRWF